jgi:hypothetical protein
VDGWPSPCPTNVTEGEMMGLWSASDPPCLGLLCGGDDVETRLTDHIPLDSCQFLAERMTCLSLWYLAHVGQSRLAVKML